ncbi:hypothetical protein C0J52_00024 [Blattella germanica]|nr:hypothetical protein C0J52_00024 [Blattella germanica]
MGLADYKDLVATAASVTTIGQFFSGAFICKDIVQKGNTENISPVPFIGGTGMGVLMLQYSNILGDAAMTRVNIAGLLLNVLYLICYYAYCQEKRKMQAQIFYTAAFVGALLAYVSWESPAVVEFRFSIIITVLLMVLIASPFASLGEVIRTECTETLPFPLILSGTVVTFLWLLYGIIIENGFVQFQNAVGFALSAVQLSLFAIYPSKPKKKADKKDNLVCQKFVQNGTTGEASPVPFVSGFLSSCMWLRYGFLLEDSSIIVVNTIGATLQLAYVLVFLYYTITKSMVMKQMTAVLIVLVVLIGYSQYEDDFDTVKFYVGFVAMLMTILFFAAPLTQLHYVITYKSTESLPFPMIAMTFICSSLWLVYGFMLGDPFIQIPNVLGCLLCGFELSLFLIYPS